MGNIIYKRKQTITGGGSSSINGMGFQGIKSSDFTTTANSIYEISNSCKVTLHSSPAVNDSVSFILSTDVNLDIVTPDKINGGVLAADYVRRITKKGLFFTLVYSGSVNGWIWDSRDDIYILSKYTGMGVFLTYASGNDTNDLFYYLGTNLGTESWINPVNRTALCTITATNWNQSAINALTDRASGLVGEFNFSGPDYTVTLLGNRTFVANKFVISTLAMGNNDAPGRIDLKVRGLSSDPWTTAVQVPMSTKGIYYVVDVNTTIEASQIRVSFGASPNGYIPEIYLYGTLFG